MSNIDNETELFHPWISGDQPYLHTIKISIKQYVSNGFVLYQVLIFLKFCLWICMHMLTSVPSNVLEKANTYFGCSGVFTELER